MEQKVFHVHCTYILHNICHKFFKGVGKCPSPPERTLGMYACLLMSNIVQNKLHECECVDLLCMQICFTTVDIDECALETDDCHTNAICTNTQGSYNCSCLDGFEDINNGRNCIGEF